MTLPDVTGKSSLEDLVLSRFKRKTSQKEQVLSVTTTRRQLVTNDPNRLFLALINEGSNDVRISTDPDISTSSGWLLAAAGGVFTMFWEEDGESVGWEVYAIAAVGSSNVRVRETIML